MRTTRFGLGIFQDSNLFVQFRLIDVEREPNTLVLKDHLNLWLEAGGTYMMSVGVVDLIIYQSGVFYAVKR